jgi:TetR/AcrR family transcriptional repressor of nem operon
MPRSQTSKKILNIAERNIMRSGYSAWSYHHIARELELKPAAIHYHYRTKSELVVAVVERYGCRFDAWARSVTGFEPAEQLAAYFEVGRHFVDRELVCTLVMLNTHREAIPAEVRRAV